MSQQRQPASELLPVMAAAFPQTFFADPKQVRPLKINIHRDLNDWHKTQALPAEIGLLSLRCFLHGGRVGAGAPAADRTGAQALYGIANPRRDWLKRWGEQEPLATRIEMPEAKPG